LWFLVRAFLTAKPPAQILRKKSRRNSSRPRYCLRAVQKLQGSGFYKGFKRGRINNPETQQRGEVGKAGQGWGWEEMRENSSKALVV